MESTTATKTEHALAGFILGCLFGCLCMIVVLLVATNRASGQEKAVHLSKQKVEMRIDQLKKEYQELQKLVDDPMLAVPNWKARMRQIEGSVGAFNQSLEDSSLFWVKRDSLSIPKKN